VEADFVFVAEGDGYAALGPSGCGIAQIGFSEYQNAAALAQLDGSAQSCDTRSDNSIVGAMSFDGSCHDERQCRAGLW
jgi:hypothetical protein